MPDLTPLAVSHKDLLRHLETEISLTTAAAAKFAERDVANTGRTLRALRDAGLVGQLPTLDGATAWGLTQDGLDMVEAMARAEAAPEQAGADRPSGPQGYLDLTHGQIAPDPLNPRTFFDEEAISELAQSIARDGLLENLVVRPPEQPGGAYRLVAGERRWRAIGKLMAWGMWVPERPIPCRVMAIDDLTHRRIALVENLQRKDLSPIEEARGLRALMDLTGQGTAEIATEIGFTQRYVQQRLQFLDLPETKQTELSNGDLTIREAREYLQRQSREALSDDQWLMLVELFHAAATDEGAQIFVRPEAKTDPVLESLNALHMIHGPFTSFEQGRDTGRQRMSLTYAGKARLTDKFADALDPDRLEGTLAGMQLAMGHALPQGTYATPWLNGGREIAPEIRDAIEAAIEERARQVEASRLRREAEQELPADRHRLAEALSGRAMGLVHVFATGAQDFPALTTLMDQLGHPLPWSWDTTYGDILDANRQRVLLSGYARSPMAPTLLMLMVAGLNGSAGLRTVIDHGEDDPVEDDAPEHTEDAEGDQVAGLAVELDEVSA